MTINEFFIEANSNSIAKTDLNFKRISKNYLPRYSFLRTSAISSGDSLQPPDNQSLMMGKFGSKKIAKAVTSGYQKIEKGVVDGYRKIEKGVVSGYTKIEDKFVDAYLTREGESVEQAKERLKEEKNQK